MHEPPGAGLVQCPVVRKERAGRAGAGSTRGLSPAVCSVCEPRLEDLGELPVW